MSRTDYFNMILQVFRDVTPAITSGILTVILLSCALFGLQIYFNFTQGLFSVGSSVFLHGHLHRLLTYPFYHRTVAQLFLSIITLVGLSSSLEKGVGTVRFLFLFLVLSTTTGLFYAFLDLLQDVSSQRHTEGLVPVALACVALTTMHTKMTKGFLCGVSFPTVALPWVFLIITTALIPDCVLLCNVIAILIGWFYGKGWFSRVDMSEARAVVLERMIPFRLLRSISPVMFVPASIEDRRKTLLPQINPTPGSYPVQAYAPLSSINTTDTTKMYEGWPSSPSALSSPTSPVSPQGSTHSSGTSHGQSCEQTCNHNHFSHSHDQL
ncbi:rhomboid domain-containing protein 2 [Scomber japonicus]|uniref:rhomboid domain-containing protein 2 n=1 Tax=Scomber japonicus TaxID=13676 RepID=UPI0023067293|nr:rhomboid domain-containing protein 2 [Scomber japonicus]